MILSEVQRYDCKQQKTGCQCLSIVSSSTERLSVASTTVSRQYVQCKRRRKDRETNLKNSKKMKNYKDSSTDRISKRSCCNCTNKTTKNDINRILNDSISYSCYFEEEDKHQSKDSSKKEYPSKKKTAKIFLSSINQSFLKFSNYINCKTFDKTPSISCRSKLNQLSKNKFRFKFNLIQLIILIIGSFNFVLANESTFKLLNSVETSDSYSNSISLIDKTSPTLSTISNISQITSSINSTTANLNLSTYSTSSLDYFKNLFHKTDSNYFYTSLSEHSAKNDDQSTTRLPYRKYSNNDDLTTTSFSTNSDHNQKKSAHFKQTKNAFHNQQFANQLISTNSSNRFNNKLPYGFRDKNNDKSSWTDRFKKTFTENVESFTTSSSPFLSSSDSASTISANKLQKDFDDSFPSSSSEQFHTMPTPSSLILGQSNKTLANNKTVQNLTLNEDFIDNLNLTDSDSTLLGEFLQPFTNLSWWTKVPFPKSGYHNYSIVFLAVFISIVMMIVVIGNLLVCIAICTEKNLKTIQNWFIASLAISDLLLGLIIMPFSLAYELMGTWLFSDLWCDFHHALDVLLTTASINNLCLISLDRYWSVTQAIEYLKKRTPCRAIFMIVFAWVFSACVCLPPLFGWKKEDQVPGECSLSNDFGYVLYSSLGSFFIPAVVMVFVYAKIFIAARSRARKHVRKKQKIPNSSEQKKASSQSAKPFPTTAQQPPASTSSLDNTTAVYKQPVTPTVSSNTNREQDEAQKDKKEESDLQKSESKGSIKQANRAYGRFTRRAQMNGINQELEENEIDQTAKEQQENQSKQEITVNLQISNQTVAESSSGIGTSEEPQINSVPTSGSSVQTEPAITDSKNTNFTCARSTSAFTYDHLFVEDRKSAPSASTESVGRPATPSSKVTFSPNDIVFDLNASGTQSISMVPQIVIHGSMQQLHLQSNVKRTRFSVNKLKDSDFNNNQNQSNEKRFGHPKMPLTGTLSAGQLDCVILDSQKEDHEKSKKTEDESNQPKRSSIKRTKYSNDLEIDTTAAQLLNQQPASSSTSPHSILKPSTSSQSSPTAQNKTQQQQQIELQEKSPTMQHLPAKQQESNLSKESKESKENSNLVSPISRTFSENASNKLKPTQADGKLNYLGVGSLQSAASISGSMMSINYDYDSDGYLDEKSSKRGFEDDEFDFDENESSNTHDEKASKRSVKGGIRHSKKGNIFTRWSWCRKWLWINEKCVGIQEEEFAGYEEDDEEEDEGFDELGRSSLRSGGDQTRKPESGHKRILKKNKSNKSYNASIISANNTSSSGTHGSGTGQQPKEKVEKKSNSLFSRFSRDNSNKSTSSGSAKRTGSSGKKERSSAKSSCSVSAISQTGSKQRKHRHKSGQLHAHSSSTAHSEGSGPAAPYKFQASEADRQKRRIAKAREKRATLILGLIMAAFILGYIPFSTMYLIQGICPNCNIQSALTITYWVGYTASAINPIIYTVFNRDFRKAFRRILFR